MRCCSAFGHQNKAQAKQKITRCASLKFLESKTIENSYLCKAGIILKQ